MKKEVIKGVIISVSFSLTTLLTLIGYAAWTNITPKTNGTTIDENAWNELVTNINNIGTQMQSVGTVPAGFIGSFYLSSCPAGWIVADGNNSTPDMRGAFVRGMNGNINGRDAVRTLGNYQTDDFMSHTHNYYSLWNEAGGYSAQVTNSYAYGRYTGVGAHATVAAGGTETRPKNVALLYCMKQ